MGAKSRFTRGSLADYHSALLAKREELVQRLYARRSGSKSEYASGEDSADTPQPTSDHTYLTMESEIRTLAEVELSLRRMDSGEYGLCGSCGEEIADGRLRAIPWTRVCLVCAGGGVAPRQITVDARDEKPEERPQNVVAFRKPRQKAPIRSGVLMRSSGIAK